MIIRNVDELPDVTFINDITYTDILDSLKNNYLIKKAEVLEKSKVNLLPTDESNIILNNIALELYQIYRVIENKLKMNLVKYAEGEYLEHLGAFRNCPRIEGKKAKTFVVFTLSEVQDEDYIIDMGTEFIKDKIIFQTTKEHIIPQGQLKSDEIEVECKEYGAVGNNIEKDNLTLINPLPYVEHASNVVNSYGGVDVETDPDYKNRILMNIYGKSTGGSIPAYEYFIRQADSDILDIYMQNHAPRDDGTLTGQVDIYLLYPDRVKTDEFNTRVNAIKKYLDDNGIRVLTDVLLINGAEKQEIAYNLEYELDIGEFKSADLDRVHNKILNAIRQYQTKLCNKLGCIYEEDVIFSIMISLGAKNIRRVAGAEFNKYKYYHAPLNASVKFDNCKITCKGLTKDIKGSIL